MIRMRLSDYVELIKRKECDCGAKLMIDENSIRMYPHDAGWTVDGVNGKQWLYIECPKCHYCWALWKLGVPRE